MNDAKTYDGLSSLVFLIGIYEGVVPFVIKIFGWHQRLAFPARLAAPAWWIVSLAVIVVAAVLLDALEKAKIRAAAEGSDDSLT